MRRTHQGRSCLNPISLIKRLNENGPETSNIGAGIGGEGGEAEVLKHYRERS